MTKVELDEELQRYSPWIKDAGSPADRANMLAFSRLGRQYNPVWTIMDH